MDNARFFARIRLDAQRNLPKPGYETSSQKEHTMVTPQTVSTRDRRTEGPVDGIRHTAMTTSPEPETPFQIERITHHSRDRRTQKTDVQSDLEVYPEFDMNPESVTKVARDSTPAPTHGTANEPDASESTRMSMSTITDGTTETPQHQNNKASFEEDGFRPSRINEEDEQHSIKSPLRERQPVSESNRYVERDGSEPSYERDPRQPEQATETKDVDVSPDAPTSAEPPPTDYHHYTLGRERTETPSHSSGPQPGQRNVKPPRLHIGEVVIRVEEDPKPQRASRRGRTTTLSDSQRLIRSL